MKDVDLIQDISSLTSVPYKTLKHLCNKGNESICHSVLESVNESENETVIDLSIGQLIIIIEDDELHYRFKPSSQLDEMLVTTLTTGVDPLITDIEQNLVTRVLNTYKDLI